MTTRQAIVQADRHVTPRIRAEQTVARIFAGTLPPFLWAELEKDFGALRDRPAPDRAVYVKAFQRAMQEHFRYAHREALAALRQVPEGMVKR